MAVGAGRHFFFSREATHILETYVDKVRLLMPSFYFYKRKNGEEYLFIHSDNVLLGEETRR